MVITVGGRHYCYASRLHCKASIESHHALIQVVLGPQTCGCRKEKRIVARIHVTKIYALLKNSVNNMLL
jgi:hypothetical protein